MKTNSSPTIHGHRGSRGTHPENTLLAFEEALSSGAHVLELDLQLTADNVPVVSHEPDIDDRLCRYSDGRSIGKAIPIRSINAADLEQFECGANRNPRFPEQRLASGVKMPTLETFLKWWKQKAAHLELNIETKMTASAPRWIADPETFVESIVNLLRKYDAVEKTILQSFDFRTLTVAKKKQPTLRLSCLFENERSFCEATAAQSAQFASPHLSLVTSSEVSLCHQKGIQVVPWTANSPGDWENLLQAGVDAIITDYPRKLRDYLKSRKH